MNAIQQSLTQLSTIEKEVQRFLQESGPERLDQCTQDIANLESLAITAKRSLQDLSAQLDRMTKQHSEVQVVQRTIDDNLKYRRMLVEKTALDTRCAELHDQIKAFDTASIESQYNKLKARHADLVGERAGLVGELKQLQEQAKRLDHELATDYKDIESVYRNQLILVKTETMASDDLGKYGNALDQ